MTTRPRSISNRRPPVAPAATLPPGVELLLESINSALTDGQSAFAALLTAKSDGEPDAVRTAAANLVAKLKSDPLALARKVAVMVKT